MEQRARNAIGGNLRRTRTPKGLSQQRLSVECARLGYELPRGRLARIESGIRAVTDFELFVLAHALNNEVAGLYPAGLLRRIQEGTIGPFTFEVRFDPEGAPGRFAAGMPNVREREVGQEVWRTWRPRHVRGLGERT
jgi:transcriptional regulator with XRE-family HTH domain